MSEIISKKYSTPDQCAIVINMASKGFKVPQIAIAVGKAEKTVRRILTRTKELGYYEHRPSGRPKRKFSERGLRCLKRDLDKNPRQTLGEITETINNGLKVTGSSISPQTVCKAIHNDLNMSNCHARLKPFLQDRHILNRKAWAEAFCNFTLTHWKKVIWTDEMSFEVGKNYRLALVWRPPGQQFNRKYLAPSFKSGRSSLMVWGAIAHGVPGPLIIIPKGQRSALDYIRIVMSGPLKQFFELIKAKERAAFVVEDGASVHTAKVTEK